MTKIFICDIYSTSQEKLTSFLRDFPFGEEEKSRLLKIKNQDRQISSLAALVALSRLIDCTLPLAIERDQNGKPFFRDLPEVSFNLSHSSGIAVAAISDRNIGVDIEFIRSDIDTEKISKRFFGGLDMSTEEFFKHWTKNEAYSKMLGTPLTENLSSELPPDIFRQFEITFDDRRGYVCICSEALKTLNEEVEIFAEKGILLKKINP